MHEGGCRFAIVDVHRATMKHHHAKVMVAAKGVIPRQPIHQNQGRFSQHWHGLHHLLLIGAPQTLRVDHGFGHFGGTTREQEFHNGVGASCSDGCIHLRGGGCLAQGFERSDLLAFYATLVHDNFHVAGNSGRNGFGIACIAGKHHAWRDRAQHMFELVVVLADERVGR